MDEELRDRIVSHLGWMIADIDFRNALSGIDAEDSPELADARALLLELEAG